MRRQSISRSKRAAIGVGIMLLLGSAIAIWLGPRVLALYHQVRGGMILADILHTGSNYTPFDFPCNFPPIENGPERSRLQKAISHLESARNYDPSLAQTYLLLGRAYCLMGEPEQAGEAYKSFVHLRSKNPLGCIELGFADVAKNENSIRASDINTLCNFSRLDQTHIIEAGNQAFSSHQYTRAIHWYQLAYSTGDIPDPIKFLWSVAEIMLGKDISLLPDPQVLSIYDLDNYLQINGSTLQWMLNSRLGKPIGNPAASDSSIGYLTFSGEAIAAIQVRQTSTYSIKIKAQNSLPPPVQLQLEINFHPIATFELSRGDGSWEEFHTETTLDSGVYILAINFLNDDVINGIDRNAVVEWIIINKLPASPVQ